MNQEFIFETLLFYKNYPCYYKIYRVEKIYYGIPSPHHYYSKIEFPHFIVDQRSNQWLVKGISDEKMAREIREEFYKLLQTMSLT